MPNKNNQYLKAQKKSPVPMNTKLKIKPKKKPKKY